MANSLASPNAVKGDGDRKADDVVEDAREAFTLATEAETDNRRAYEDDVRFARLGEQWPERIRKEREDDGRPCLTTNLLPAFIRQVVNDARQNKPQIQVHPVDSVADPETADIIAGLIRNIETVSNADIAYDTAMETTCSGGWGYWTVSTDFADDDTFDLDLRINAVADPLTIFGDPYSTAADSSDWMSAFETEMVDKATFQKRFGKNADDTSWSEYERCEAPWSEGRGDRIMVAKWWRRERFEREIVQLVNGAQTEVLDAEVYAERKDQMDADGFQLVTSRKVPSHKVTWSLLSGVEELDKGEWGGRYIPIIPVYGDVVHLNGRRHLRSMIRDAKDPARMTNYWDSMATETVALAPKSPYLGRKGAFATDMAKWETANSQNHPFIEYDSQEAPQRQAPPEVPSAALEMRSGTMDAMRRVIGIHDPNLGVQGDATSGRMLIAEQKKGDTSNFHFIDNVSRAIRHTGVILIDLIPQVYSGARVARVLGIDGKPQAVALNQPTKVPQMGPDGKPAMQPAPPDPTTGQPPVDPTTGQPAVTPVMVDRIYDLSAGKYDLTVKSGPSFASQREEQAVQMTALITAAPELAVPLAPLLAEALDWHGADKIAPALEQMQQQKGDPQAQAQAEAQGKMQAAQAEMQGKQQLAQQQAQQEGQLAQQRLQQEGAIGQQKAQQDAALERYKAEQQMQLAREVAAHELALKKQDIELDFQLKRQEIASRIPTTPNTGADVQFGGKPG